MSEQERTTGATDLETPVLYPQHIIQFAIDASDAETPYLDSESYDIAYSIIQSLSDHGYVIARAADCITAEQRADLRWVLGIISQLDHYDMDEWPVIERLSAIANGGTE